MTSIKPCPYCAKNGKNCPGIPLCKCQACLKLKKEGKLNVADEAPSKERLIPQPNSFEEVIEQPAFDNAQRIPIESDLSRHQPLQADITSWLASSQAHGNADKYGFYHNAIKYLAKPESEAEAGEKIVENEFVCNTIGQVLGLNMPMFGKSMDSNQKVFVQQWFTTEKRHFIHLYRFLDPILPYSMEVVNTAIKATSSRPNEDSLAFAKMIIFDCIIGNTDRHARNIGFIQIDNSTRLSPVYDNISGILPDAKYNIKFSFKSKIVTQTSESPNVRDCIQEVKRLWPDQYKSIVELTKTKADDIRQAVLNSDLRTNQKNTLVEQLKNVIEEMDHE
ncbi:MAG: HipA domain-containing protein [Proteobacteria bacterium]|nr:MAG: HipA domain-containing protein [Pseudomonadota bacterium]